MDKIINNTQQHSEDIQDIITTPPSALLRWGISGVFFVLLLIIGLSAFIRYPDIVQATVRISSVDAPKAVISKLSGTIVSLRVAENEEITKGQHLAWLESTADHQQVIDLLEELTAMRDKQVDGDVLTTIAVNAPTFLSLGELQNSYQAFYQAHLSYQAAIGGGILLKRKQYLLQDLGNIQAQREQLALQENLQKEELKLAEQEFHRYQKLAEKKVISTAEFQQQQAAYLSKQHPLQQTQSARLSNDAAQSAKMKEVHDLDNQIMEEKSKYIQALNSLISEMEKWQNQYVMVAQQAGTVAFAGFIQQNQHVTAGQEVFYVNPQNSGFFGEVTIPQYNMGKVQQGQEVLVKLNSYPFEEFGILRGNVQQVSHVATQDSIFLSKVTLDPGTLKQNIQLKTGLLGTAEIITEDASLLSRLYRNITKLIQARQ